MRARAVGLLANGVFVLALALFAKHALDQVLVYDVFMLIGSGLVGIGLYQGFVKGDD